MSKEKIKPCPFCGSENVYEKIPDSTGCLPNYVKCYTCGAYTTVGIWNKRKNIRPETADKKGSVRRFTRTSWWHPSSGS